MSLATYTDVSCSNDEYQVLFQCDYEQDGCSADMAVAVECCELMIFRNYGGNYM